MQTRRNQTRQKIITAFLQQNDGLNIRRKQFSLLVANLRKASDRFKITTSGVDHAGIVYKVCRLLSNRRINIIDMETRRVISAESGTPLFEMDIDVEVPRSISEQGLREDLHHLANELMIDLVLKKEI
jgi:glycine cleavage system regulatory protein